MRKSTHTVSLVVIARDAEASIGACLSSALLCREWLVVVDSRTRDGTAERAERLGARVLVRRFSGYAAQKNAALEAARGSWILSLDADERLHPALASEIEGWIAGCPPGIGGASMPRLNHLAGQPLRGGGWSPDRRVRLVRRGAGRFQGPDPHDVLVVEGPVAQLNHPILHYAFRDAEEQRSRGEHHARDWARSAVAAGRRPAPGTGSARLAWKWIQRGILQRALISGPAVRAAFRGDLHYERRKVYWWRRMAAEQPGVVEQDPARESPAG